MPRTIVKCSMPGCHAPATHRVAAPWRAGDFSELKTYAHACAEHSGPAIAAAQRRPNRTYPLAPGEAVGEIGIYSYQEAELAGQLT